MNYFLRRTTMITDNRIREMALGLFKQESARDKQKKVGASDFSDPCEYHLAKKKEPHLRQNLQLTKDLTNSYL
jgi:hypothetical protein